MSGPVPKRSDQRRRANVPEGGITRAPASDKQWTAKDPSPDWHPMARDWYVSLLASGQSAFYEGSDWETARIWAEILSRQLRAGTMNGQLIAAWSAAANELLTTEGARRRARLELERDPGPDPDKEQAVAKMAEYRAKFGA